MGLPDNAEGRPGQDGLVSAKTTQPEYAADTVSEALGEVEELADDIGEYVAGVRRRREAADRLPPLADGRRDPWDPPRGGGRR